MRWSLTPKLPATVFQSSEVNCGPLSEERSDGVPKRVTQVAMNARATSVDVTEDSGTASDHRVVWSTMVRRCVNPQVDGSCDGPGEAVCNQVVFFGNMLYVRCKL